MSKILVIDDEEIVREATATMLRQAGHFVSEAGNGEEALQVLQDGQRFDLIVTDLVMPGKEGLETIQSIRKSYPELRLIAMSGAMSSSTYLRAASALGATVVLQKPFRRIELLDAVKKALC